MVIMRLMMLPTLVGGISLQGLWMPEGSGQRSGSLVSHHSVTSLCPELLSTMTVVVVMLFIFVYGIGWVSMLRWLQVLVNIDFASLLGTHGFVDGPWVRVSVLCERTCFFASLHRPADGLSGRHFVVSFG